MQAIRVPHDSMKSWYAFRRLARGLTSPAVRIQTPKYPAEPGIAAPDNDAVSRRGTGGYRRMSALDLNLHGSSLKAVCMMGHRPTFGIGPQAPRPTHQTDILGAEAASVGPQDNIEKVELYMYSRTYKSRPITTGQEGEQDV